MKYVLLLTVVVLAGCGSAEPPPADNGPKLTQAQAEQYKGLIPGNRKSQTESEK